MKGGLTLYEPPPAIDRGSEGQNGGRLHGRAEPRQGRAPSGLLRSRPATTVCDAGRLRGRRHASALALAFEASSWARRGGRRVDRRGGSRGDRSALRVYRHSIRTSSQRKRRWPGRAPAILLVTRGCAPPCPKAPAKALHKGARPARMSPTRCCPAGSPRVRPARQRYRAHRHGAGRACTTPRHDPAIGRTLLQDAPADRLRPAHRAMARGHHRGRRSPAPARSRRAPRCNSAARPARALASNGKGSVIAAHLATALGLRDASPGMAGAAASPASRQHSRSSSAHSARWRGTSASRPERHWRGARTGHPGPRRLLRHGLSKRATTTGRQTALLRSAARPA